MNTLTRVLGHITRGILPSIIVMAAVMVVGAFRGWTFPLGFGDRLILPGAILTMGAGVLASMNNNAFDARAKARMTRGSLGTIGMQSEADRRNSTGLKAPSDFMARIFVAGFIVISIGAITRLIAG